MPKIDLAPPPLHKAQQPIIKSPARFKVVCCGRRFGKTVLGIFQSVFGNPDSSLKGALQGKRIWWVAPSYKEALEGWQYLQRLVQQMPKSVAQTNTSELTVRFAGGGSLQVRTGDDPDNLRGSGLDGVVIDEAATMKPDVWYLVLRPALADKRGWAMFIGTPKHYNWFYDLYARAESGVTDWACWQHPTWDNPYIDQDEIDSAQRDMTPEDFDQEFGASFTAVGGAVFRLLSTERARFLRPMPAGQVYKRTGIGEDWGTTPQHKANVTCASLTTNGAIWFRSSWLSDSGSSDQWRAEAVRCQRDYGATFARVDRSQSSELDRLRSVGYWDAAKGIADVQARIGDLQGLILRYQVFWDINGNGIIEAYNHFAAYHRDRDGKVVEEYDDDVDGGLYVVSELVRPTAQYTPPDARVVYPTDNQPVRYGGKGQPAKVHGGVA